MPNQLHPLPGWEQADQNPTPAASSGIAASASPASSNLVDPWLGHDLQTNLLGSAGAWVSSLGVHLLLLFGMSLIVLTLDVQRPDVVIESEFAPLVDVEAKIIPPEDTWTTDVAVPVLLSASTAIVEKSVRQVDASMRRPSEFGLPEPSEQVMAIAPEVEFDDISEVIPGVQGEIVTTNDDIGSVDRITTEILSALKESKVLVVWLLDASESLRIRRSQIIGRFDRIYQELGELSEHQQDALLTSVVAFGETATLMTKTPTANPAELRRAVRRIPVDGTGIENVFGAVQTAAMEYRAQARKGYRVMLVVLTDESGSDPDVSDQAVRLVKQQGMPVYVLGPLAPFSRHEIRIPWVDPETSVVHRLPVERGPATAVTEYPASLFRMFEKRPAPVLSSGFAPFGLAKLAHESGGICFVYNDGQITGPKFDSHVLTEYAPDYVSHDEYQRLVNRHPLRKSVLTCSVALQEADFAAPKTEFLAAGIQFEIRSSFAGMEQSYDALEQVVQELMSVRKHYTHETSRRWRAHYDLLLGQMLIRRLQIESCVPLFNGMYEKPQVPVDVTCNAFAVGGIPESSLAGSSSDEDPDKEQSAAEMSERELARLHLERVVRDHAGTPWATLAQAELEAPLAVEWRETFVEPPEGQPLPWDKPPREWKQLSKEDQEKLEAAREKFERFRRFRAEQKKKKEEQERKAESATGTKKREPPKL